MDDFTNLITSGGSSGTARGFFSKNKNGTTDFLVIVMGNSNIMYSARLNNTGEGVTYNKTFSDDVTLTNNLLSTAPYTVAFDEIAPGASQTKSVSVHRDGYKAIGCVGWANTKSFDFYLYQCLINNNETLSAFIRSVSDSAIPSGASVIVDVLFVKNS